MEANLLGVEGPVSTLAPSNLTSEDNALQVDFVLLPATGSYSRRHDVRDVTM